MDDRLMLVDVYLSVCGLFVNDSGQGFQTCKWTVQIGQATSLIRLPDPSVLEPVKTNHSISTGNTTGQ